MDVPRLDGLADRYDVAVPDPYRIGLAVLSAAIAIAVVTPLIWIVFEAATVEPGRAIGLLTSGHSIRVTFNSLVLMAAVTAGSIAIGVPLAFLTARTDLPYARLCTILAALPLVIPSYIGAIAFVGAFGAGGQLDTLFGIGLPRVHGLNGAIFIITLYTYPYVFLTTRAALLSMDASVDDAARTLNVGRLRAFRRVTLPQIRPGIAAGALLAALYAVSDFGTPAFMRAGVFTSTIYWEFSGFAIEYAALLALQLVAIVAIVLVIEAGIGRDADAAGATSGGAPIVLGGWRWPALGAIAALATLTLLVPIAIFVHWLIVGAGDPIPSLAFRWEFAWNSVYLAAYAAVASCAFALPVAYYAGRHGTLGARVCERATYVGFAVPGIVIALALVFLGTRTVPSLYRRGVWLLVFAYVVRFLPQAVGTVRSSVLQLDDRTIEAARTLGASRFAVFRRITLPQLLPGVVAGAILVFLTTMKELPITMMLQPIGMDTLVIIIWDAQSILAYRYAAVPALLLIGISGLTMLVLLSQERLDVR